MRALTLTDDEVNRIEGGQAELRRPFTDHVVRKPILFEGSWLEPHSGDPPAYQHKCPFGAVGDLFWAQESWYCDDYRCQKAPFDKPYWASVGEEDGMLVYRAEAGAGFTFEEGSSPTWHPAETMPEWAARIWLRVVEVRVERVDGVWMWVARVALEATP